MYIVSRGFQFNFTGFLYESSGLGRVEFSSHHGVLNGVTESCKIMEFYEFCKLMVYGVKFYTIFS